MKLGAKLTLALGTLFLLFALANIAVLRKLVWEEFERIELAKAGDDARRCQEVVGCEAEHLRSTTREWAYWDDMYRFMLLRNQDFASSNLKDELFEVSDFQLLYIVDAKGDVVWGAVRGTDRTSPLRLAAFPADRFATGHPLLRRPDDASAPVEGVVLTEHDPMLVCAMPIMPRNGAGPARGTLILGQFLSRDAIARLREMTRVDFDVIRLAGAEPPPAIAAALAHMPGPDDVFVKARDDETLSAYAYVPDIEGKSALLIEAHVPREITRQSSATMRLSLGLTLAASILGCIAMLLLVRWIVVGPLVRVTAKAAQIGRTGDLSERIDLGRTDEIGTLAREFDGMVGKLAETRARLLETSRNAGMADVASGVLHNVGNVLNSVNVSTTTLAENVRKSKVGGLLKAAELLDSNRANVAEFITQDERGRNLPTYLRQLAQVLVNEQRSMLGELGNLKTSVDHMNQVIQSQHTFARRAGHVEPANLRELVTHALAIMDAAFKRHGIAVNSDLAEVPTTMLDAGKCVQILVNILTNAKDAMGALPAGEKIVSVRLRRAPDGAGTVDVTDNGVGIASENLSRIFSNGFTTKSGGRGFGLHFSALAAREMGGQLTAHSDGPGRGARLTLQLPLKQNAEVTA